MIVFDIAGWIANLFILSIASLIWIGVIFGGAMIISMTTKFIKESFNGDINEYK